MSDDHTQHADRERLRRYYASGAEAKRLESEDGWFELERTLELVTERVDAGSRILDLGGGAGVHARRLAGLGHRVTLVDLSPELIEIARSIEEPALEDIVCDDIATFETDDPFDAVLCLGPGYHAGSLEEFREMCRLACSFAKPGGWVFLAFIPRMTGVAGLVSRAASHPEHILPGTLTRVLDDGVFRNDSEDGFAEAYFANPDDVRAAMEDAGATTETICSVRGFAAYYGHALRSLRDEHPTVFAEVLEITRRTQSQPEVVSMSWHAMYIGRA